MSGEGRDRADESYLAPRIHRLAAEARASRKELEDGERDAVVSGSVAAADEPDERGDGANVGDADDRVLDAADAEAEADTDDADVKVEADGDADDAEVDGERAMHYLRQGLAPVISAYVEARTGEQVRLSESELRLLHRATNDWLICYARCHGARVDPDVTVREAAEMVLQTHDIGDTAALLTGVPERRS